MDRPEAEGPLPFHCRTGHFLPKKENVLQKEVDLLQKYAEEHSMKINQIKTKVAIFNPLKCVDIMPEISLTDNSECIEVVEEYKLLGQIIRSDMKTISNTDNICKKAFQRMWILRRLKELGCEIPELLDVLRQQILSVAEQAVPHWGPMISKNESNMIERILKTGLHIIYQQEYCTFTHALKLAHMKSMSDRRRAILISSLYLCQSNSDLYETLNLSSWGTN